MQNPFHAQIELTQANMTNGKRDASVRQAGLHMSVNILGMSFFFEALQLGSKMEGLWIDPE